MNENTVYAAVLIRSRINVDVSVRTTLDSLNLLDKNVCVLVGSSSLGMLRKAKDYITYGEVSEETVKELLAKRGVKGADGKPKRFFRLAPPRGGFERKGIKIPYNNGGAAGYRGAAMNDLLKRMI